MSAGPERPFVHMNVAATADGKIDTFERRGATISSPRDKERVDRLRADSDAIMVGGRTLHDEDPKLTVSSAGLRAERLALGRPENPVKVGVATKLELKTGCDFLTAGPARIMLFTTMRTPETEIAKLRSDGVEVDVLGDEAVDVAEAMRLLRQRGIERVLVEGGARLNFALLNLGLVDELTIYVAPAIFGGDTAPTLAGGFGLPESAAVPLELIKAEEWENGGLLLHYRVPGRGTRH